jgi:Flp pilus assembly protein TadG
VQASIERLTAPPLIVVVMLNQVFLSDMKLFRDRKGVAAVEFAIIVPVLIALLLPIADVGIAAMSYISAYQSVRDAAAYAMYNPPKDLNNIPTTYLSQQLPPNTSVIACGDTVCTTVPAAPTSLLFTRTITLKPFIFDVGCSAGCKVVYLQPIS